MVIFHGFLYVYQAGYPLVYFSLWLLADRQPWSQLRGLQWRRSVQKSRGILEERQGAKPAKLPGDGGELGDS